MFVFSSILSALIGLTVTAAFTYYKLRWRWRHIRDILNFGDCELVFVVPHRQHLPDSVLPRVAAEDVLAMMNVISLMTRAGLNPKFKIRDITHLSDEDKKKNIVTIGGAEVNGYTDWILNKVTAASVHFERDPSDKNFILKRGASVTYTSPSRSVPDGSPMELAREDVAFLFKFKNPLNEDGGAIVVGIAGLRGIGTWAAGDCLRKKYREIHVRKRRDGRFRKSGEFIMFLSAQYENFDITATRIMDFEDLS